MEDKNFKKNVQQIRKQDKKKKKSIDQKASTYLSFNEAAKKIAEYGKKYSVDDFIKQIFMVVVITVVAAVFLKLKIQIAIIIAIGGTISLAPLTLARYKEEYQQDKYTNLVTYMEQMIMCFRVQPKVLYAMTEALKNVTNKHMRLRIKKACNMIHDGNCQDEDGIYGKAFKELEKHYNCPHLKSLHRLLEKIETTGGNYQDTLNVFFDDLQQWDERVRIYHQDRKIIKNNVTWSIVLSLAVCVAMGLILPDSLHLVDSMLYQISTCTALFASLILYVCLQFITAKSWFDQKETPKEQIISDYNRAVNFNMPKEQHIAKIKSLICIIIATAGIMFKTAGKGGTVATAVIVAGGILAVLFYTKPKRVYATVMNHTKKEIEKAFPDWLRDIALSSQTKTVQNAIAESYKTAPIVLKPSITKMLSKFQEDPIGNSPYTTFLEEFDLPDIKSAVKMLYTINEVSKESMQTQINQIISTNNRLFAKAEEIHNDDIIASMQIIMQIPMLLASAKMMCDMISVVMIFIGSIHISI